MKWPRAVPAAALVLGVTASALPQEAVADGRAHRPLVVTQHPEPVPMPHVRPQQPPPVPIPHVRPPQPPPVPMPEVGGQRTDLLVLPHPGHGPAR